MNKNHDLTNEELKALRRRVEELEQICLDHAGDKDTLVRLHVAVENSGEAIFLTDPEGIITYVNPEFTRLYGWSSEEVVGKVTARILKSGTMNEEHYKIFWETIAQKNAVKGEWINKAKDGRLLNIEGSANPVMDDDGKIVGYLAIQRDITARKAAEEKLHYLSNHDPLTDLYNRAFFEDELVRLESSRRFPISILIADLNNLKSVNDQVGHSAGDALLKQAAQFLKKVFRAEDTVARIGGDEFGALLAEVDANAAEETLARLTSGLEAYAKEQAGTRLSLSFGIATGEKGDSLVEVMKKADQRMYKMKKEVSKRSRSSYPPPL